METTQAFVLCELAEAIYALAGSDVQHVELVPPIARVPDAPLYVEGVALVRGRAIPVVNLRLRFGLPWQPHDPRSRLVVVGRGGRTAGLLVDSARELVRLPAQALQPPPAALGAPAEAYLAGVFTHAGRLVLVLQVDALLSEAPSSAAP